MDYIESVMLGIIQGLTEFLPISSSGHLEISKVILGNTLSNKESLLFTIVLHCETAFSTIFFFRKELIEIINGLFSSKCNDSHSFSVQIIISMIPAVFIGLFFEKNINSLFDGNLILVGSMLFITALLLFLSDFLKMKNNKIGFKNSFLIGIAQAVAILPGISRSGATIASAVILGIDREKAARFSFIMVIPLILGSMAKSLIENDINFQNIDLISLFLGFFSAFFTGLLACKWMISLVKKSKLYYFSIYCIILGSTCIIYST